MEKKEKSRAAAAKDNATRAALELACSEARAAGVPLETVLDLCRRTYGEM